MIRAVAYTRVSSEEQTKGVWLSMQAGRIRAYCVAERWEVVEVYSDPGISGAQQRRGAIHCAPKYRA